MDKPNPFFSIIVLCWNNNQTLPKCLDAVNAQTDQDFEILLIDNGSTEPISRDLLDKYSRLVIYFYTLEQNTGFAGGNNFAASRAKGNYLVLLNADAYPNPDWLETIRIGIKKYPNCFFASKLIMANSPERMDGMGDVYHFSGLVWRNAYNTPISSYHSQEKEVFSACGAAAIYPSDAIKRVNGFDDDYFSYVEDIDLGFRLRLIGYKCIYLPNAVVYHVGSGSTARRSDLSVYYGQRNLVWTFIKDVPGIYMWVLAPIHLVINLLMILLAIFRKQGTVTIRAKRDAFLKLPAILRKRQQVQRTRTVTSHNMMRRMDWNPISPIGKLMHK
jgi:GT2 family glycosyltransferase